MQIRMEYPDRWNTEQIRKFLEGSGELQLQGQSQKAVYAWIRATLVHQEYARRKRREKGLIRAFLSKVSGRSVPQITRLIRQFLQSGEIVSRPTVRRVFPRKYTPEDITLLSQVDQAHQRLSGPATRRILQREFQQFHKPEFQRLAHISVSHLYNLRASSAYRRQATQFDTTRPTPIRIGERRKPEPNDRPG